MTKPTSPAKNRANPDSLTIPRGTELVEHRIRRSEKEIERRYRLSQGYWSFLVKDLLAYLIAFAIVIATAFYCFWVLMRSGPSAEERRWAISILTSVLTAVVGFAFGKATK
ncbi:hypothetical protein BH23PLA1_BH23PLA1_21230 [soil metagenome]